MPPGIKCRGDGSGLVPLLAWVSVNSVLHSPWTTLTNQREPIIQLDSHLIKGPEAHQDGEMNVAPCERAITELSPVAPCERATTELSPVAPCERATTELSPLAPCERATTELSPLAPCVRSGTGDRELPLLPNLNLLCNFSITDINLGHSQNKTIFAHPQSNPSMEIVSINRCTCIVLLKLPVRV